MNKVLNFLRTRIWSALPKEITPAQCRPAAWLWGGALVAFAAYGAWRHTQRGEPIGLRTYFWAALGIALAAALLTQAGPRVYIYVLRFFSIFGYFISHIIMTLGYYLMVTPLALVMRSTGRDALELKPTPPTWKEHSGKNERRRYFRLS